MNEENPELLPELRNLIASKAGAPPDWKPKGTYVKSFQPDAVIAPIVGSTPLTRAEIGRRLWCYIREHNLQDPVNKWVIHSNEALAKIMDGEKFITAIELMRRILKHVKIVHEKTDNGNSGAEIGTV